MRHLWVGAFFVFFCGIISCLHGYDFAVEGQAKCVIAVPEKITDLEIIARDELSGTLEKITGAKFQVIPENQVNGPAIYVGNTEFARKHGILKENLGKEEWVVKTVGKDLVLTGGGSVGPFYAVESVLKKAGYYMLTFDQEVCPKQKTLILNNIDEQKKPAFDGRYIYDSFPDPAYHDGITNAEAIAYNMYELRNYQNGNGLHAGIFKPFYTGDMYSIPHHPPFHSLMMYVPPDKYFKTHPEYYCMDENGNRVKPFDLTIRGCLCMSNPDVVRIASESLLERVAKDRTVFPKENWPVVYDMSLLDDFYYICHCPECKKLIAQYGGKENGGETGLMLHFSNQVAAALKKKYPDVTLRIFAYNCATKICPKIKPLDNILVQYCDLSCQADPYRSILSPYNKKSRRIIEDWAKMTNRIMIWDYWNEWNSGARPETMIDAIQPDMQFFRKNHVVSLFLEAGRGAFVQPNFILLQDFIASQLMCDPDQDVEKLIEIYMKGYYGPASGILTDYLNALRKGVKAHEGLQISACIKLWSFLTPDFCVQWYKKLSSAEKIVPADSPYRIRVTGEKLPLLWHVCLMQEAYKAAFEKAGFSMTDVEKECHDSSLAFLYRFKWERRKRRQAAFEQAWEQVAFKPPVPALFKDVPFDHRRIIGYTSYREVASHNSYTVNDPEASCGKAFRSANKNPKFHGVNKDFIDGKLPYNSTEFFFSCMGQPGTVSLKLKEVPQDEKYHWYRVPGIFDMKSLSYFWAHSWGIQMNISQFYIDPAGAVSDVNQWNGWFRAKFTGPAYVPGSKQENAIWIDLVVMTRPNEPSLSKLPAEGLVD